MSCALCERIERNGSEASDRRVYEDELAVVLVDSAPSRRREALVIPKAHYRALADLDERLGVHLMKLGMRAALSLGAGEDELQVLLESPDAESAQHVHVRVYPRGSLITRGSMRLPLYLASALRSSRTEGRAR